MWTDELATRSPLRSLNLRFGSDWYRRCRADCKANRLTGYDLNIQDAIDRSHTTSEICISRDIDLRGAECGARHDIGTEAVSRDVGNGDDIGGRAGPAGQAIYRCRVAFGIDWLDGSGNFMIVW